MTEKEIIKAVLKSENTCGCALERMLPYNWHSLCLNESTVRCPSLTAAAKITFGFSEAFSWGIISGWDSLQEGKDLSFKEALELDVWASSDRINKIRMDAGNSDYSDGRIVGQNCWKAVYMGLDSSRAEP